MIGLRHESTLQKKKRNFNHPILTYKLDETENDNDTDRRTQDITDDNDIDGIATSDISTTYASVGEVSSSSAKTTNFERNYAPTRYQSKISLLRDITPALICFFVLYKIVTHPMVANVGMSPPRMSQRQLREQIMYSLFLKRQQNELHEKYQFYEAIDITKCHIYPAIDMSAKLNQQQKKIQKTKRGNAVNSSRRKADERSTKAKHTKTTMLARGKHKIKKKGNKMNRPMARRDGPTPSPIASLFRQGHPTSFVNKGSEAAVKQHTNQHEGGILEKDRKKDSAYYQKTKKRKKKFGSSR